MVKFVSDPVKSCAELLVEMDEAGIALGDWLYLASVVDPEDSVSYNVVCFTEGEEMFAEGYDEAKATEEFLALMHTVVTIGV